MQTTKMRVELPAALLHKLKLHLKCMLFKLPYLQGTSLRNSPLYLNLKTLNGVSFSLATF